MSENTYPFVEKIYNLSENVGELLGIFTAKLLNSSTFITVIGLNALKKGNEHFLENSRPAFQNSKKKISESVNDLIPDYYKRYFDSE